MSDKEYDIVHSPLSQKLTRDGKTIDIEIYGEQDGGWILEVVDEYGNSTVWDNSFDDDQSALDCVLETVKDEGINALVSPPSDVAH